MNKELFLATAVNGNSFISESKIIAKLSEMGKSIIISMDKLEYFSKFYLQIKEVIGNVKKSQLHHVHVQNEGKCEVQDLGNREIDETEIINLVSEKFRNYSGFCFVVDSGLQYLYTNGKIDGSIKSCLEKTKTMQKQLDILKPVSSIREVFAHFRVSCNYTNTYYDMCFTENGMIKKEIKEQELRNILLQYLKKNMQGDVITEFCTDYLNDEESVDIYLNDGNQRAIIEVKFSISKKYYEGSTYYGMPARIKAGINQLDKYARHLAKDARLVDYGYVYMFYMNDLSKNTVKKHINENVRKNMEVASDDMKSIFSGVETSNMKKWASEV